MALVDRIGRRPLLMYSYLCSGITLAIMGTCFFIDTSSLKYFGIFPFIGLTFYIVVSTTCVSPIGFVIAAEIFPVNVKSVAMTLTNLLGGFLNFTSVKGYQGVKDLAGLTGVFWFYSCFGLAGAAFTYYFVPETKGKSLREIQIELQGNNIDEAGEKLHQEVENGDGVSIRLKEVEQKEGNSM